MTTDSDNQCMRIDFGTVYENTEISGPELLEMYTRVPSDFKEGRRPMTVMGVLILEYSDRFETKNHEEGYHKGGSQTELAEWLGVSQPTLSNAHNEWVDSEYELLDTDRVASDQFSQMLDSLLTVYFLEKERRKDLQEKVDQTTEILADENTTNSLSGK